MCVCVFVCYVGFRVNAKKNYGMVIDDTDVRLDDKDDNMKQEQAIPRTCFVYLYCKFKYIKIL